MPELALTPEIETLIQNNCQIAIGISGGKDSGALALALNKYLNQVGHPLEKRVLVHSDLGLIEWPESLQWCEKTAQKTGIPLLTVRRKAGGMIERWETRWNRNWERYLNLECIKVILPWSTASMRFCTSELKTDVICSALKKRFPTGPILSACGIRAEESFKRARAPIWKVQPKLRRKTHPGYDWNPLLHWKIQEVFEIHKQEDFPLHPAYEQFGASRVSCAYCILSGEEDKLAALRQPANHPAFLRLCQLEVLSGFGFQKPKWLFDLDPDLLEKLDPETAAKTAHAKIICEKREAIEALLPKKILFVKGKTWPAEAINRNEAELIATVRKTIFDLYEIKNPPFCDPEEIQESINKRVETNNAQPSLAL